MSESREEAAAKAIFDIRDDAFDDYEWEEIGSTDRELYECQSRAALAAADAHDAAHGIHRVTIDAGTVERVAEVLLEGRAVCECKRSPFDKHDVNPPCSTRTWARQTARAVLAAAVEAGQ